MSEERKKILSMVAEGKITVEEAEQLLDALSGKAAPQGERSEAGGKANPKYLRVVVEDQKKGENVNIRVPLALIRAGIKLGSILPDKTTEQVNSALKQKGIDIDLSKASPETVEELVEGISGLTIDVTGGGGDKGEKVRVFCE